jgi:hypothetical protein
MWDTIIQAIVLLVLPSFYIAAGLRVLLAKRPFMVIRAQAIIGFAPMALISITTLRTEYLAESWPYAFMAVGCMAIVSGIVLWSCSGGLVIGATETTLRDALRQAVRRLGLSYEESSKAFRLPALNNELIVEASRFDGMFPLRLKRFGDRRPIRQLAAEINEVFRTAPVRTNRRLSYTIIMIGAASLLIGSWLTYQRLSLHAKMRVTREAHSEFFKSGKNE